MKSILLLVVMLGLCRVGFSQSEKLNSGDSIRIELARTALSKELIELRDSINVTLLVLDAQIKKSMPSKGVKLITGRQELTGYKDQLELDIKEITQTGRNSWSAESMERIQLATTNTRREYKRICTLL